MIIYFAKSTMLNVFTNRLIQKSTLCDINYIFGVQGMERTYILQFYTTLLEPDFSRGSFLTEKYVHLFLICTIVLSSELEDDSLRDEFLAIFKGT